MAALVLLVMRFGLFAALVMAIYAIVNEHFLASMVICLGASFMQLGIDSIPRHNPTDQH